VRLSVNGSYATGRLLNVKARAYDIPMSRVLQLFVASETKIPSSFENLTAVPQVSEVLSIYVQYSKKSGKLNNIDNQKKTFSKGDMMVYRHRNIIERN
jgi:hypothetical protein